MGSLRKEVWPSRAMSIQDRRGRSKATSVGLELRLAPIVDHNTFVLINMSRGPDDVQHEGCGLSVGRSAWGW